MYQSNRIQIRPLRPSDRENTQRWHNDPAIREQVMGFRFPVSDSMESKWLESAMDASDASRAVFAIDLLEVDECIGYVQLNRIDWISRIAYLGITIGEPAHQGNGYGKEALDLILTHALNVLNLRKICIEICGWNSNALRFYTQYGFEQEGCLKGQVYLNNDYHDLILMGFHLDEWKRMQISE